MPTERADIIVRIGSGPVSAKGSAVALDDPHPYVEWDLPTGIHQSRFSVRIGNDELNGFAYITSGPSTSDQKSFRFPGGMSLGQNFEGRCKVEVAISSQAAGDFEYVSSPLYFVYDRRLEKLFNASEVILTWQAPTDPDGEPQGAGRLFHLQVSRDVQFTDIAYENPFIVVPLHPTVTFSPTAWVPDVNRTFFYRIRMSDGLDWGNWSRTNAFKNFNNAPPVAQIVSVNSLGNSHGDVEITFDLSCQGVSASVEISFSTEIADGQFIPVSLIDSLAMVPPGRRTVTWRSMRQMDNHRHEGIVLLAVGVDESNYGPECYWGPFTIDNSFIHEIGGGIGNDDWVFNVRGFVTGRSIHVMPNELEPVGGVIRTKKSFLSEHAPVSGKPFAWPKASSIGPLENRHDSGTAPVRNDFGWGSSTLKWPKILIRDQVPFDIVKAINPPPLRINPHTCPTKWMFANPAEYSARPDGWPVPQNSRTLLTQPYLAGFVDMNGVSHDYPSGFDWNTRPAWHVGREMWKTGDAWVQALEVKVSHYEVCGVCHGTHWTVMPQTPGTSPYVRVPCANLNCVDGFDASKPMRQGTHHGPVCKGYVDIVWMKLSEWIDGQQVNVDDLFGLAVNAGKVFRRVFKRHIVGHQTPSVDMTNIVETTRQPGDGVDVDGYVNPLRQKQYLEWPDPPATRGFVTGHSFYSDQGPVRGNMHGLAENFATGVDPGSHAGHSGRSTPTQVDGMRVSGKLGVHIHTKPLSFRFMQAYWDAYNTIHWQATGSESSTAQIQLSAVNQDGRHVQWDDVRGDNSVLDSDGAWITSPLTFHLYWDTSERISFPSGTSFQLRLRQYDSRTRTFGPWVYSTVFQILQGVTNPVSILSTEYEPWSKVVSIKLRCDDSERDRYALTAFWYSLDDGETWKQIGKGDISGDTANLSSDPDSNIHEIKWATINYGIQATDGCRIRIDALPTDALSEIQIPIFKWLTPNNPLVDAAEVEMTEILGRFETRLFNEQSGEWEVANPPVRVPGNLGHLEQNYEYVRQHSTTAAPDGMYTFASQDVSGVIRGKWWGTAVDENRWSIVDQSGYEAWLQESYTGGETHGQAMSRISSEISYLTGRRLPELRRIINAGEINIRKRLIDQGFFAEDHFGGTTEFVETIAVLARDTVNISGAIPVVTRWWRFRVQSIAEGPAGIYDAHGEYKPANMTSLESVNYKWELDFTDTFDSQINGRPLRHLTNNYDGTPLAVTKMVAPGVTGDTNPAIDSTRSAEVANSPSTYQVGGTLKLAPALLPGKVSADQLPAGQGSFQTTYTWRVAAYNPITKPVTARPRAQITRCTTDLDNGVIQVDYLARSHERISEISLGHSHFSYRDSVNGFKVSRTFLPAPVWADDVEVVWISDRRSPMTDNDSRHINPVFWTWPNTTRKRASVSYDDHLQEYLGFMDKPDPGVAGRTRITGFRGQALPNLCEYDVYFDEHTALDISGPSLVRTSGGYRLYFSVKQDAGSVARIAFATSADADTWSSIQFTDLVGASPNVTWDDDLGAFVAFIEVDGEVKTANSADGATFGEPTLVVAGGGPSAIKLNGAWVLYYHTGSQINSITGSTPTTLGGVQVEVESFTWGSDTFTPGHPGVFIDLYCGNPELHLMYTADGGNGISRIRMARLEDRQWENGVADKIYGETGNLIAVPSSRAGVPRHCAIAMSAHGVLPEDSVKVRLLFTSWSPTSTEYHRQSDWVTIANKDQSDSVMEPDAFRYDPLLDVFPYLKMGAA